MLPLLIEKIEGERFMKRNRMMIGKSFIALSGMVFAGAFLCGCSSQSNEQKEQNDYEEIYTAKLDIEGNTIPLEVWTDKNMSTNGIIKINGQEITIPSESESIMLGYAHAETIVCDFTGDGKEEIALIAAGGASGSVCAVQVFSSENDNWFEMDIPSEIYDNDGNPPKFVQEKLDELNETISFAVYNLYRSISIENEKIVVSYPLWADTDDGSMEMGTIQKEIIYSPEEEKFVLGDSLFLPETNESK